MTIPNLYHFIWIGNDKPYFLFVAIQSVLLRCKESNVILWTDTPDEASPQIDLLKKNNRFVMHQIVFEKLTNQLDPKTQLLFSEILKIAGSKSSLENTRPIERSRSNLLRYLILYMYGGVYLDADTLVLKDMAPLNRTSTAYFGKENSIWPIVKRKNLIHRFIWAPLLEVFRFLLTQLSFGYKLNRVYQFFCSSFENNAVLGFTQQHNYLLKIFEYISTLDRTEILRPLRLGPFLFQRVSKIYKEDDFLCYPEKYFYPYGPLISQHFFRRRKHVEKVINYMISDQTYVVHWGASTKYLKKYTKEEIMEASETSVFNKLCSQVILEYEKCIQNEERE